MTQKHTFTLMGILMGIVGVLSLMNPVGASIVITILMGIAFLLTGIFIAWFIFQNPHIRTAYKFWGYVISLLGIMAGVWLLAHPLKGVIELSFILGLSFMISGSIRFIAGFAFSEALHNLPGVRGIIILSGAASFVIGILIFSNFADIADKLLGIVLGIELLVEGAGLIGFNYFLTSRLKKEEA